MLIEYPKNKTCWQKRHKLAPSKSIRVTEEANKLFQADKFRKIQERTHKWLISRSDEQSAYEKQGQVHEQLQNQVKALRADRDHKRLPRQTQAVSDQVG